MSVEVTVRRGEHIDAVLMRLRRGCLNANILTELKSGQYYIKPSLLRHAKNQEEERKRKYRKRKEAVIAKFGIDSVPRRKQRGKFS